MTVWKQALGWTYRVLEADNPCTDFRPFDSLFRLWRSKIRDGRLPAWRDFDFADFAGWHGWLRVGDIVPGRTDDFVYRLWGVHAVDFYGVDHTGKRMSELDFGFDEDDRELLTMLATDRKITLADGPVFWQDREHVRVQVLKMPLADDGHRVDKFLGAFQYDDNHHLRSLLVREPDEEPRGD